MIRKYLSKEYFNRPHVQYNSAMLIRILADNPGPTFTRNFDVKFVQAIKHLLREGRDPNVKQLLIETLNKFQRDNQYYEGIELLLDMWQREQTRMSAGRVRLLIFSLKVTTLTIFLGLSGKTSSAKCTTGPH